MGVEAERLAARAAQQHRDGSGVEAERLYRAALAAEPGHAGSLHGLGCLAHAAGRPDLAIGLIGQAVTAAPEVAAYTLSLGLALLDRGHLEQARAALHVAVLRDETDPRAHRALAQALSRLGRLEQAETHLRRSTVLDPRGAAAWLSLGGVLRAQGCEQRAMAPLRQAVLLAPGDALAWHTLGACCAASGALVEAEAALRRAAELRPDDPAAQANLGTALFGLDRLEEARPCLERAQALSPDVAATLSSLGLVLIGLGETIEAEAVLSRAVALAPDSVPILVNHGTALAAVGQMAAAEAAFRAVLSREPDHASARFNHATVLLARGARQEGWAAFEARGRLLAEPTRLELPNWELPNWELPDWELPDWDGRPIETGAVLIRAEQGLGDIIQFLRWVPAAALRAPVVLEVPPALLRLVRETAGFNPSRVHLLASGETAAGCVAQAPLLSLPHLLGEDVVPQLGLRADAASVESWRQHLPLRGLRVGLSWAGSSTYRFDRSRSMMLSRLAPLSALPGVALVSLQQGTTAAQAVAAGMTLTVPEPAPGDLADTAALIASLDLVISVDTMIAHLAGALGQPVWLLDRFGGDWRWQHGFAHGRDWYPGLRRFAPASPRPPATAWDEVIAEVAAELSRRDAPPPVRS